MPYNRNSDLPAQVRDALPSDAQSVFRRVFNQNFDDKGESAAFAIAWTAVKSGWKRQDGEWIKKADLTKINLQSDVFKVNDEQRMVYGWASVITENGADVVDIQGDVIKAAELVNATTEFMKSVRTGKQMHMGEKIGTVVHSLPLTADIAKSLGIATNREGWIVGMHIEDDAVWKAVKDGELSAFSIGGSGTRKEIE